MPIPIPQSTAALLNSVNAQDAHLGLRLFRFANAIVEERDGKLKFNQEQQSRELRSICNCRGAQSVYSAALQARNALLDAMPAPVKRLDLTSAWRLVAGLSGGGAMENAAMTLHPIYGVPIIPGSSLKGLARAYAVTCWLPEQPDKAAAWEQTLRVFGNMSSAPWVRDLARKTHERFNLETLPDTDDAAGAVVFHDAWPHGVPKIEVDIVNNHHKPYYQDLKEFPADWQSPEPSYFAAVAPDTKFSFAVSLRHSCIQRGGELLDLAALWLQRGLADLGAGAKTAAGYGHFLEPGGGSASAGPQTQVQALVWNNVTIEFLPGPQEVQAKNPDNLTQKAILSVKDLSAAELEQMFAAAPGGYSRLTSKKKKLTGARIQVEAEGSRFKIVKCLPPE